VQLQESHREGTIVLKNIFSKGFQMSSNPRYQYQTWFFDPTNTWFTFDSTPLKESLEKFAKFPIATSFEKDEPRLLLVTVDVQEGSPVVFDSYEKDDGIRKSGYGRYGKIKSEGNMHDDQHEKYDHEHVIRYDDGITSNFVLASCSVPINYNFTRLEVEDHAIAENKSDIQQELLRKGDVNTNHANHESRSTNIRYFWDGGFQPILHKGRP
jgi:NTE family protein